MSTFTDSYGNTHSVPSPSYWFGSHLLGHPEYRHITVQEIVQSKAWNKYRSQVLEETKEVEYEACIHFGWTVVNRKSHLIFIQSSLSHAYISRLCGEYSMREY